MFPYNRSLVDETLRTELLGLMAQGSSYTIITHNFQEVFWSLLVKSYLLAETYMWLTGRSEAPADVQQRWEDYFDARSLLYWFWTSLCDPALYDAPRTRLPDGNAQARLYDILLNALILHPFPVAMNTWYSTCIEWLQVCNIEWYYQKAAQHSQVHLWKPGEERHIPGYLAGYMALDYF